MHAAALIDDPFHRESKTRKPKRNSSSHNSHNDRHSIKDPKIFKQLVKNSEKHEISKLIEEFKDDKKNGIGKSSSCSGQTQLPPEAQPEIDLDTHVVSVKIKVPKEFDEKFLREFKEFLAFYRQIFRETDMALEPLDVDIYDDENYLKLMSKLYYLCEENFYEANAIQLWRDLPKCFSRKELEMMEESPRKFYVQYLFLFDRYSKTESKTKESLMQIAKLDPGLLTDPTIRYAQDYKQSDLNTSFFEKVAGKQCVLLKEFVKLLDIDHELFSIETILQNHPGEEIDVMYQNPDIYGFIQNSKKAQQIRKKITIQEYCNYQRECMNRMPQNIRDSHGMIKFAVNIDIEEWKDHMKHLDEKIPPFWLYNSEQDAMKYINQKIKGVNLPQIYLKVEGAWSGGHEENLRLRAINLNHGPDSCVWYTIGTESVPAFRKLVKEKYNLDIHKDEGLWFGDIDLCIKNDIKIQYFVQEPGDIVLLGPGCLHWVRCSGITMNSAWNICGKDKLQFEKAFEREKINREIGFRSLIPMKHIAMEVMKHDTFTINQEFRKFLAENLQKFYKEELEKYYDFQKKYPGTLFTYEHDGSSVYNCVMCNNETLNFYAFCDTCSRIKKPRKMSNLICLGCYEEHLKICRDQEKRPYTYCKLTENLLLKVQNVLQNIEEEIPKMKESYKSLGEWIKEMVNEEKIALENSEPTTAVAIAHKKHSKEKLQLNQENHGHSMKRAMQRNIQEEEDDKMEEETSPKTDENLAITKDNSIEESHVKPKAEVEPEPAKVMEEETPIEEELVLTKKKSGNQKSHNEKEKAKSNKGKQSGKPKSNVKSSPESVLEEVDEKKPPAVVEEEEEDVRGSPQKKKGNSKVLDEISMKRKQSYHNEMKEAALLTNKNGASSIHKSPEKKNLVKEKPKNNSTSLLANKDKSFGTVKSNTSPVKDLKGSKIKKLDERTKENKKEANDAGSSESDGEGYQIKKKTKGSGENGAGKKHDEESKELQLNLLKGSNSIEKEEKSNALEGFFMKSLSE